MSPETLGTVVLLGTFFVMILLRFPIAYAVGLSTILCLLSQGQQLVILPQQMVKGVWSFSLMAVPFFITMGVLMGSGGISEKLIALRREKGLSQVELAEELNVSRQAVSRWETGEAAPSLENLRCLRDLYNVSLDYLVCDEETQEQSAPPQSAIPRVALWIVAALFLVSIFIAVTALLLSLRPPLPQEASDPLKNLDGTDLVIGKNGETLDKMNLEEYNAYYFTHEPLDSADGEASDETE